jgi:hypothetical protein
MKAFWHNAESSLLESLSLGVRWDHNRENHIYMFVFILETIFQNLLNSLNLHRICLLYCIIKFHKVMAPENGQSRKTIVLEKTFFKNHLSRKVQIHLEAFRHSAESSLLESWSGRERRVSGGAIIGKIILSCIYTGEIFIIFS